MTQTDIDPYGTMAEAAKLRLAEFIRRCSGQHKRAIRKAFHPEWGVSIISTPEYMAEQNAKNSQIRGMLDAL